MVRHSLLVACVAAFAMGAGVSGAAVGAAGAPVVLGLSTSLSGPIASLGQAVQNGVQLEVDHINAGGGLLGRPVKLVAVDDDTKPATGASNARALVTRDHAVALIGPAASSIAAAEQQVSAQYKVPLFMPTTSDIGLTTRTFNPYTFRNSSSSVMEPRAVAIYLARALGNKHVTLATMGPDFSYGHDTIAAFEAQLKALHVNFTVVKSVFPPLGVTNLSPYLTAIIAAHPDYLLNVQYGGDLVAFTKQAERFGVFKHMKVIANYGWSGLKALGNAAPAGAIAYERRPFWGIDTPEMAAFVQEYHAKYKDYPNEMAIMGYEAAAEWAAGVKKADSFDGARVSAALPGSTYPSLDGPATVRACDHQSEVKEWVSTVSAKGDPKYDGVHLYGEPIFAAPFKDIALTCAEVEALRR